MSPSLFAEMRWRNIGPYRAGRTKAAAGHPSQPYTFYMGMCNGGVWKTTDAGRTWKPIFDDQPTGSIGWVAVAPSNPSILYVATGEGLPRPDLSTGDGIYKSTDAGNTWTHLGLRDAQQIPKLAVDPKNPNRLFVAALGHPYGPNEERGIFRSTDGGRTFQRVLFKDVNTGGKDVDIDPANPDIVYATLWEQRQGPWENAAWNGTNGGIFKSTDGGTNWKPLTQGLPAGIVNAEIAIAPTNPRRVYATVEAASAGGTGIYRSDDAGETWTRATTDTRPTARINEVVPHVSPKDPDTLIVTDIVSYKSTDGGRTFVPFKGAPGGDDYQNIWWNPDDPNIMLLVADQGAVVTLNGGQTWSSWYTQPTAALYHVMADNAFPYRVCGGQQDSGSACVASRGNDGQITFRDWHPVGVEEYGYVAPDPLDPDLVYGGKVTRYDRRTGQVSNVGPVAGGRGGPPSAGPAYRTVRTQPVVFSTVDPRALFYGNNVLWKTIDGGINWKQISPDLTREKWDVPKSVGTYTSRVQARERGAIGAQVIYTIGPSYRDINRIWIGTDDGLIYTTANGGLNWTNVTPPQVTDFMKVFTVDPGRFDPLTAYAAVNTLRIDDMNPHIYRTHDGGKTWKEIVTGIPGGAPVSVVREDPKKKGLLFAGSETQVYVSFDDGDHWQSLRLNMAPSSVRDLDHKRRRPRRRHARARDLDPRRHHAAAADRPDDCSSGGGAVPAAERVARAVEHVHRYAAAARRAGGAESARGGDHQLLPEVRGVRAGDARDRGRGRPAGAPVLERRRGLQAGSGNDQPAALLVPPADGALDRSGHAPVHVGPALSAAGLRAGARAHRGPGPADRGNRLQHRPGGDDALGESRDVHGEADGERQDALAADRGEAGPAREDTGAGDAAGLHAVEGGVLRRGRRAAGGA